jgi:hypothetical protein
MSRHASFGTVLYSAESSWAEASGTPSIRLPVLDAVDLSGFKQSKIEPGRVVQRLNDGTAKVSGPQSGEFKIKLHLAGHGSATSGATSLTSVPTLLAYVFGASAVSAASGTTSGSGTATVPVTAASGTFTAGSLCRIGVPGDARGEGAFAAIATHITTSLTLLTAVGGAPTGTDIVHSAETVSAVEAVSTATLTGLRFLLMTGNLQVIARGCYASGVSFSGLGAGEVPMIEITFKASTWEFSAQTFPSATSMETFTPAINARSTMFLAAVGTATRAVRTFRSFSLSYDLGIVEVIGPTGVSAYQNIVGAVRGPATIKVEWVEDADAATASPVLAGYWDGTTEYHLLLSLNNVAGAAMGMYFPRLLTADDRPTSMADANINRVKIAFQAHTGPTTTTDLTASAFRMGFA